MLNYSAQLPGSEEEGEMNKEQEREIDEDVCGKMCTVKRIVEMEKQKKIASKGKAGHDREQGDINK